jgi:hypothetical protein
VTIACSSRPRAIAHGLYVRRKGANNFEVRELTGGKSNVAFSYRIVGRRKDIKQHRRFAKVDMGLPLLTRPPRAPRKPAATAADVRAFVARVEKDARERAPKGFRVLRDAGAGTAKYSRQRFNAYDFA